MAQAPSEEAVAPVVPMLFRKAGAQLNLFTAIATLGTPRDVTAQELRVESFFPMDAATAQVLRGWAAAGHASAAGEG
jgi:hypothetical protein